MPFSKNFWTIVIVVNNNICNSASYLRIQRRFTYIPPHEKRTRKLRNLGIFFLSSQTHLPVVILTAGILFKVTVLLQKLLEKNNKIRGSASVFAMKHAIFLKRWYFQGGFYRQTGRHRKLTCWHVDELI